MRNRQITSLEASYLKKTIPTFDIGDEVNVGVRILEGGKERVQPFIGIVISRRGTGTSEMFTVRRIVNNEGVERTFPVHSPKIAGIEVRRRGKVRRAKLYFLRERVGKSRRLRERRESASDESKGAASDKPRERELAGAV